MTATIGTISSDLTHAETILQIADSLDHLQLITQSIFQRIQSHIDDNLQKLDSIDTRIKKASEKVEAVKQHKQRSATCLYSSNKFPSVDYADFALKKVDVPSTLVRKQTPVSAKIYASAKHPERDLDQNEIKAKLHFYHVKPKARMPFSFEPSSPKLPPSKLWSAASYLLFNTAKTPFGSQYIDPLEVAAKKSKAGKPEIFEKVGPYEAPSSLTKNGMDVTFNEDLYVPEMEDLPDFELPDELPDLPGIAQNAAFDSPEVVRIPDVSIFENQDPVPFDLVSPSPFFLPVKKALPPPPPVNPPPKIPEIVVLEPEPAPENTLDPQNLTPRKTNTAMTESSIKTDETDGGALSVPREAQPTDSRANLMEAIRNAGGMGKAGLKSVKEQKDAERQQKQETQAKAMMSGGDLMSDLANKLAMRRKGISGTQKPENPALAPTGRLDSLATISSLIPPPPPTAAAMAPTNDSEDSDDDWN